MTTLLRILVPQNMLYATLYSCVPAILGLSPHVPLFLLYHGRFLEATDKRRLSSIPSGESLYVIFQRVPATAAVAAVAKMLYIDQMSAPPKYTPHAQRPLITRNWREVSAEDASVRLAGVVARSYLQVWSGIKAEREVMAAQQQNTARRAHGHSNTQKQYFLNCVSGSAPADTLMATAQPNAWPLVKPQNMMPKEPQMAPCAWGPNTTVIATEWYSAKPQMVPARYTPTALSRTASLPPSPPLAPALPIPLATVPELAPANATVSALDTVHVDVSTVAAKSIPSIW
ncbi:hypothetical protein THASP1DRAFT_23959 [Thamnocephalis sphaerospora]|uniref:Ubiquitin-like domain-containing protein n=1 Tax=Thamnocephalis sphaerospora TaxID=78915 RepID=A0A4V1IWL5_9FUNG|nr:hypothetical protein THASP1DRAFT_23959 [Thamnocephalis sphaerospora]|eukprot:RKP07979.1 hypothetical protein THASP1DRAFT_23959 [Thamnocephalis sphaerospora]